VLSGLLVKGGTQRPEQASRVGHVVAARHRDRFGEVDLVGAAGPELSRGPPRAALVIGCPCPHRDQPARWQPADGDVDRGGEGSDGRTRIEPYVECGGLPAAASGYDRDRMQQCRACCAGVIISSSGWSRPLRSLAETGMPVVAIDGRLHIPMWTQSWSTTSAVPSSSPSTWSTLG